MVGTGLLVPECESTCRFSGSSFNITKAFESFVELLSGVYGVQLQCPQLESAELSRFCSGLIEGDVLHPWRVQIARLSAQSRFGIAHSLFLFRKVIPKKKPLVEKYVDILSTPQEEPDQDFADFAKREVRKIFPYGWDRKYQDYCLTSSLPLTSCAENGRSGGGSRGWGDEVPCMRGPFWSRWERADFCEYVLKAVAPRSRGSSRVQAIETGGKWRIISIPPQVDNALRPLHKAMYSHLSRFPWLLRGDAKPSKFKDFTPVEGEIFVSGDYESATDNLNSRLQKVIMGELLARSYTVPTGIAEHALSSYDSTLVIDKCSLCPGPTCGGHVQRRGQLMGQLTSFPLLCLVNYITFRYAIRRSVPVRINGDDIVFRATPAEVARWERIVAKGGLTLSLGKTLKHGRAFTLNSTPFWAGGSGGRLVGFVRAKALFPHGKNSEQTASLNGRFYSVCAGYGGWRQRLVRTWFLHHNSRPIHLSRRSVTRGLGLAVDREMLHITGMWHRELFYLEQVVEKPLPFISSNTVIPVGWVQISSNWLSSEAIEDWRRKWSDACVEWSWHGSFSPCDVSEDTLISLIRRGCSPYGLGTLMSAKVRGMLRLSRNKAWKWVNQRRNESVFGRVRWKRGRGVWVDLDLLAPRSQVTFLASNA